MSNYSVKESESNFELISEIGGDNPRVIDDIEVKIKPKSFESDKGKNASVDYVHTILDKLIADLNDTFIFKLNDVLKGYQDYSSSHNNPNKVRYGFMVVGFVCQQRIVMT
ncbi:MAG: hypothetical protein ACEY3M_13805 [Wolbachia sp.]